MKPNGFVFAASITSHTLIPIWSRTSFISLTRAMFTARKMFSRIFAASATSGEETGTTASIAVAVERHRDLERGRVHPADDLGDGLGVEGLVAGVLALGREGEEEVLPALEPRAEKRGRSSSRVVPG